MSFMRRKPKLTTVDEIVRADKNEIGDAMLAPLRRESSSDSKAERKQIKPETMEALKCELECLTIIDDIITAKLRHRANSEIKLYDALIKDCYEFYKHDPMPENPEIKRRALIEMVQNHAVNAGKSSDKKSGSMTSFGSDMVIVIKAAIHRAGNKKGAPMKLKRESVSISEAQTEANRMFRLNKKSASHMDSSNESAEENSPNDSDNDSQLIDNNSNEDKFNP